MDALLHLIDVFLHLDVHLAEWAAALGPWLYVVLFLIVFCETGLVVTPFLPGDSLLFAAGALCAIEGSPLSVYALAVLLVTAAVAGDAVNYSVGRYLGPAVFTSDTSRFLNKKHLLRTQEFYERHGGKTILLARFVPIVRTFAPFVAGIGQMRYAYFATYNVTGALAWVLSFLFAGYWFGQLPAIKRNFHLVIVAIIVISILPMVFEYVRARRAGTAEGPA
ncbi:MAG TPA: DedA family protein [Myxococcota bacterium]|nr:DedA family protein [Myxococcota bacterium]